MRPPALAVGKVKVHLLSAGSYLTDGGVAYGIVPKALWENVEPGHDQNRIRFGLRCLLIEANGLTILVDNGYGDKVSDRMRQNLLLEDAPGLNDSLAAAGFGPEQVDLVIDSHLHADHCGGNTTMRDGVLVPAFPKARYLIQHGEYEAACSPNERTRATYLLENYRPLADAGLVDFVAGDFDVTPSVRIERAPGHTADHTVVRIHDSGETALFLADLAQRPVQMERLAWVAAYDILPMVSIETKRRVVEEAVRDGHRLIFQHSDAVGRLVPGERGPRFVADEPTT